MKKHLIIISLLIFSPLILVGVVSKILFNALIAGWELVDEIGPLVYKWINSP